MMAMDFPDVTVVTANPEETARLGERIGERVTGGFTIALSGELGCGKTVMSKGICRGLGVKDLITSPTFIIINEYEGRVPVYHVDLYRIDSVEELSSTGLDHCLKQDGVTIIEWAEKVESGFPAPGIGVSFEYLSESERKIELSSHGEEAKKILETLETSP